MSLNSTPPGDKTFKACEKMSEPIHCMVSIYYNYTVKIVVMRGKRCLRVISAFYPIKGNYIDIDIRNFEREEEEKVACLSFEVPF